MGDKKEKNLLELRKVLIPDFQRDYAQGRNTVQSLEIRENFISDIRKALDGTGMRLDFVYGKNEDGYFVPYDGQQRLTTLFLVHLYLLKKLDQKENSNLWNNQIKLEYQTSWECSEFIKDISDKKNKLFFGEGDNLKLKHLESVPFINPYVLNDDGVKGMLRTLSTIDECLGDYKIDESIIEKLKRITFYVYDEMEGEGIQFYLKMNTRGLALAPFENFRSKYAAYLKERGNNANKEVKISKTLTNKCENFFYNKRGKKDKDDNSQILKEISEKLMSLIKSYFSALYSISDNLKESKEITEKGFTPFSYYSTVLDGLGVDTVMKPFIRFLNYLSNEEKDGENNLTCNDDFWFSKNLKEVFDKTKDKSNELLFMIKYFELDEKFKYEKYSRYMRLMMNLEGNGVLPGQNKVLFNLLFSTDLTEENLLNVLKDYNEQRKKTVPDQVDEEIEKLGKIIEDDSLGERIINAEKTAFADGCICFLFCGDNGWSKFETRLKHFGELFAEYGVKETEKESVVTAYIKLTPWDWCEQYFNTSRDHWKKTIFSGIRDKDYGAEYGKIIDGLLSCDDITKIEMLPGETDRATQIKKSLLDNKWFIRWMLSSGKRNYGIEWKADIYHQCPIFHEYRKSGYIYWDAFGWKNNNENIIERKEINKFFKVMAKHGVKIDKDYYVLINEEGKDVNKDILFDSSSNPSTYNIIVIVSNWYSFGSIKFYYRNKCFYLLAQGMILTDWNEDPSPYWNEPSRSRWIYKNWGGTLLEEKELKEKLDMLVEKGN